MKNLFIAAVVGGLILFIWQFMSWTMINVHGADFQYSPNQDVVLQALEENLEEGNYFMPTVAPGTSQEEHEAMMADAVGKPWASIQYHESFTMNMGMNMTRALIINILAVLLLAWILMKIGDTDFKEILLCTIGVGLIGYFTTSYLDSVWFDGNSIPELIDTLVQWGLCGAWLGYWLNRK